MVENFTRWKLIGRSFSCFRWGTIVFNMVGVFVDGRHLSAYHPDSCHRLFHREKSKKKMLLNLRNFSTSFRTHSSKSTKSVSNIKEILVVSKCECKHRLFVCMHFPIVFLNFSKFFFGVWLFNPMSLRELFEWFQRYEWDAWLHDCLYEFLISMLSWEKIAKNSTAIQRKNSMLARAKIEVDQKSFFNPENYH